MTDTPPARHREWIISSALVALAGTVFVGARALEPPASTFDEFLPLVAAQRVLAGEVPYRDYTTQYPPLMTWLDAALLSFAKPELLATRALCLAIVVVGLVVVTRLAARIVGSERKGAAIGLATALAHGAPPWSYSLVPATVLVLSSFLATLRARASGVGRPRAWLAVAGLLLGLAALARHEAAAFGAIPVLGAVFLSESARGRRAALSSLAIVAGTAAVLPLAFLVFVVASGAASGAWEQLVRIPALVYPDMRRLPWPLPWRAPGDAQGWPAAFSIYAPFVVGALALGRVVREWRAAGEGDERGAARLDEGALASLALVFVLCATVRADRAHVYAASLSSFAAIAVLARAPLTGRKAIPLVLALALVLPSVAHESIAAARVVRKALRSSTRFCEIAPRRGLLDDGGIDEERERALALVKALAPGARIFVGLPRHDRIWINDVAFYFDAGALPATRHHELPPLIATTDSVQSEIVAELDRGNVPLVVLSWIRTPDEPNASTVVFPAHVLDLALAERYSVVLDTGHYKVLSRRR